VRAAHRLIAAALAEIRKQIRDEIQSKRSHRRNSRLTYCEFRAIAVVTQ
jgi:hypothetical protein